jgi:hypothetical protein
VPAAPPWEEESFELDVRCVPRIEWRDSHRSSNTRPSPSARSSPKQLWSWLGLEKQTPDCFATERFADCCIERPRGGSQGRPGSA